MVSKCVLVVNLIGLGFIMALGVTGVTKMEAIYYDIGNALPVITQIMLDIPEAGYVVATTLLGIILIIKEIILDRHLAVGINCIALCCIMVSLGIIIMALMLPLINA